MKIKVVDGHAWFDCPGCGVSHIPRVSVPEGGNWTFNWDMEKPTLHPSVLVRWSHPKGYTNDNPAPVGWVGEEVKEVCHSFVRDGKIQFLEDCTHALAGQTVDLPELED